MGMGISLYSHSSARGTHPQPCKVMPAILISEVKYQISIQCGTGYMTRGYLPSIWVCIMLPNLEQVKHENTKCTTTLQLSFLLSFVLFGFLFCFSFAQYNMAVIPKLASKTHSPS